MSILDPSVRSVLDDFAARTSAPGAGAAAALSAMLAAALTTMVARFSDDEEAAVSSEALRARVEPLADADGEAYGSYLDALRLPKSDEHRSARVAETLSAATDVPMEIAEVASEIAGRSARLARDGNPRLRGDAIAATLGAAAAARSAAVLVQINLRGLDDPRQARARALALAAQAEADEVSFLDRPGQPT